MSYTGLSCEGIYNNNNNNPEAGNKTRYYCINNQWSLCKMTLIAAANGASYQHVCGRARGYQKGSPDAFVYGTPSIDLYVDGLSITYVWRPMSTHIHRLMLELKSSLLQVSMC